MDTILVAVAALSGTSLICGLTLVIADRFFALHEDARIEQITALLPGINCGGCGYAGCSDYAKAIASADAPLNLCAPGGIAVLQALCRFMGVESAEQEHRVAIVLCGGDDTKTVHRFRYNGVADCAAAASVAGGDKLCRYGCLGYGSCARVCPVNAIEIIPHRLAVVHPDLCIGCGRCVRACPRGIIKMIPAIRTIHVLCSSKDKGPVVKQACQVGCIGCTLCTKLAENEAIKMDGALAVVDYSKPLENEAVIEKCPSHCIVRIPASRHENHSCTLSA